MEDQPKEVKYFSLQEATKFCSYSQEYLSLRARQGKLRGIKLGRNWMTTKEWLDEYLSHNGNGTMAQLVSTQGVIEISVPENLPVGEPSFPKKIREINFGNLRPAFAAALTLILLIGSGVFGKEIFFSAYKDIASVLQSELKPVKEDILSASKSVISGVSGYSEKISGQDIWVGNISGLSVFRGYANWVFAPVKEGISSMAAFKDYGLWITKKTTGNPLAKDLVKDAENLSVKISGKYFALNDSLEKELVYSSRNIREKISESPQFVSQIFKKAYELAVSPVKKIIPAGKFFTEFVKKDEFEKLRSKMESFEKEPVIIKRVEVEKVVEPVKEITREIEYVQKITKVDEEALKKVRGDIEYMQSEIGKRLYAPGGVISQTIYVKEPIQSPKIYQENGEIVLQTRGSGNVILSAATGLQMYGSQVVIDSTSILNPLVYIADQTKIDGQVTAQRITLSPPSNYSGDLLWAGGGTGNTSFAVNTNTGVGLVGNFTVTGNQTYTGSTAISTSSASTALTVAQSGSGLAAAITGGLEVYPAAPKLKGSYQSSTYIDTPRGVAVSGNYAYVITESGGAGKAYLVVIDISNPASPAFTGYYDAENFSNHLSGSRAIQVVGKYAYIGDTQGLDIFDISNPSAPTFVADYGDGGQRGVYISGKYAYLVDSAEDKLSIVDISNPVSPALVGSYTSSTYLDNAMGVAVYGKYAYIIGVDVDTLAIIDVSDPSSPVFVGSYTSSTYIDNPNYVPIYVSGRYAYVTGFDSDSLAIIDIASSTAPTLAGSYISSSYLDGPSGVVVSGKYAYVTAVNSKTLAVINISSSTNPTLSSSFSNSAIEQYSGFSVVGKYAYITSYSDDSFSVIDISGIDAPAANIGDLTVSTLDVNDNALIKNSLYVQNGLNVGSGGIYSEGPMSIYSYATPLTVISASTSLALDVSGTTRLSQAALSSPSKVSQNIIFKPMFDLRSLVGTQGEIPIYRDSDNAPTFEFQADSKELFPGTQALKFSYSGESVAYSTTNNLGAATGTISFWYSPDYGFSTTVDKYLFDSASTTDHLRIFYDSSAAAFVAQAYNGANYSTVTATSSAQTFSADDWIYVVMTYAASSSTNPFALYINNVKTANLSTWAPQGLPSYMYIGSNASRASQAHGLIADFNIFDRVLSQQEIQQIYYQKQLVRDYASKSKPGPGFTVTVAASDSRNKEMADFITNGTDDQVEINAAITIAANNTTWGGTVLLMGGTYSLTSPILMKDYVHLKGEGPSSRILPGGIGEAWPNAAITSADESTLLSNVEISDLNIDGEDIANTSGIRLSSFDESSIHDNYFYTLRGYGIFLDNAGGAGGPNEFAIYDNFIDGVYWPVYISNMEEAFFSIHDNIIWGGGYHGDASLQVSGASTHSNGGSGGGLIANNRITGMQGPGIEIVNANYMKITGNVIGQVGRYASNTYDGIIVSGTSKGGQISDNAILSDALWIGGSSQLRYGINISAGTVKDWTVTNNKIYASGVGSIGTNPINSVGTNILIAGNHNSTTTEGTFHIEASSTQSVLTVKHTGTSGIAGDIVNIFDNTTEVFTILDGGNVGIATTTPSAQLAVAGKIFGTGQVIFTYAPQTAGVGNIANSSLYINPTGAVSDANLLGISDAGTWVFRVDKEGDVFIQGNLTTTGTVTQGTSTIQNLVVEGHSILGDAANNDYVIISGTTTITANDADPALTVTQTGSGYGAIITGGNVGIGTTTPRYALDVWGDMAIGTSTDTNTPALYVDSGNGGRIGIGTTTLAGLLTVGTSTPRFVVAPDGRVGIATSTPSDTFAVQGTSFFSATTSIADGLVVGGSDLYVSSNGNVGIGTASPGSVLDISGSSGLTFRTNNNSSGFTIMDRASVPGDQLIFQGNAGNYTAFNVGTKNANIGTEKDSSMAFWTVDLANSANATQFQIANNATYGPTIFTQKFGTGAQGDKPISFQSVWGQSSTPTQLVLSTSGNVGIGTTVPGYKLTVSGGGGTLTGGDWAVSSAGSATTTISSATSTFAGPIVGGGASFIIATTTGNVVLQPYGGNVGIASTTPSAIFAVQGQSFFSATSTIASGLNVNAGQLYVQTGSGNVGIGTTVPGYKLTVSGGGGTLTGGDWAVSSNGSATTTISSATSTFAGGMIVDTNTLYVMADTGYVGIGTSTPYAALTINESKDFAFGSFNEKVLDDMEGSTLGWTRAASTATSTESTIVKVGSQSLKITASSTEDEVVRKTFSANQDLSGYQRIGFWIYADRFATSTATTTQLLSFAYHDAGGAETTSTIRFQAEGKWQYQDITLDSAAANIDAINYIAFRIDFGGIEDINFYIDQIRAYNSGERSAEMFVGMDGNLVILGRGGVEIGRADGSSNKPGLKVDTAVVEINQPLSVDVGGDVGFDYDIQLLSTGLSQITSEGPLRIAGGDPNHGENLTLTVGGTGDIIVELANASSTFMVMQGVNASTTAFVINSETTATSTAGYLGAIFQIITDVSSDENVVFSVDAGGSVRYDMSAISPASDVAENYKVIDESIGAGDVVCLAAEGNLVVEKCSQEYQTNLLGAISTRPALWMGDDLENSKPVALNGRVPVKISLENGLINIGDPLTSASSTPGFAMKATRAGKIFGYALEPFTGAITPGAITPSVDGETLGVDATSTIGTILVFIHLDELGGDLTISQNEAGDLVVSAYTQSGQTALFSLDETGALVVGKIKTQELCVGSVCVTEADFMRVFGASVGEALTPGVDGETPGVDATSTDGAITPEGGETESPAGDSVSTTTEPVVVPDLPDSVIDSGPELTTTSTSATFFFHANKEGTTFTCQIDSEFWAGCESPKTYSNLSIGFHQFKVQAIDISGLTEPSPAVYDWEIVAPIIIEPVIETSTTTEETATSTTPW